ncbi:MAG: oligosaccharide flippase family protein [Anaerolineales bacterium]|nr:oligosaccharide flippase family protein [Anaerolineales bacterium]
MAASAPVDEKLNTGLRWSILRQGITALVGSLGALAYTRYLQPEELGAFALALIVYAGLLLLVQAPFRDAVIYFQHEEEDFASAAFWLLSGLALAAFVMVQALAGWLGGFYDSPEAASLTRVISYAFLLQAVAVVPAALLLKQFRFAQHEIVNVITFFILLAGWLLLAPRGFGAWTLIYPQLAAGAFYAGAVWWLSRFRPCWRPDWAVFSRLLGYSRSLLGSKLAIYLQRNLDNALIGRFGTQTLGWYTFGEDQSAAIVLGVGHTIAQITLPALAAVQEQWAEIRRILGEMLRLALVVGLPAHVGAFVLADVAVALLFGEQWAGGVPILRAYLALRAVETLAVIGDAATSAIGRPEIRLRVDWLQLPVFALTLVVGLLIRLDIATLSWLLAAVRLSFLVVYLRWTLQAATLAARDLLRAAAPATVAALLMGLVVYGLRLALGPTGAIGPDLLRLGVTVVAGILVYVLLLYGLDPAGTRAIYWQLSAILLPPTTSARLARYLRLARLITPPDEPR